MTLAAQDQYILGVISATPAVVGGAQGCNWQGMYIRDEWGAVEYEWVDRAHETVHHDPAIGEPHPQTRMLRERRPRLNPEYNPQLPYSPRNERNEWAVVGLLGKLIVRDDGSCKPNGYCRPGANAMATASAYGYRVLKRLNRDKVLILLDGHKWMHG